MRHSVKGLVAAMLGGALAQVGCGPEGFAPPPNLVATPNTTTSAVARVVYLVLPGSPESDPVMLTWATAGQAEATARRAIFRVAGPEPGAPPSRQAEAIRRAIHDGASALVVVPHDPRELALVLSDAESRGVPVVTLGASAPDDPPLPGTSVVPEHFDGSADRLVDAAVEDARARGDSSDPPAVILIAEEGDRFSAERVDALKAAAHRAGLTHVESLQFEVKGEVDGRSEGLKALTSYLKDHPETSIVMAEGDEAMAAASRYRSRSGAEKPIIVAGYIGFLGQTNPDTLLGNSAFVEGRIDILARLAVRTALAKAAGEQVAASIVLPTPLNRSIGSAIRDEEPSSITIPKRNVPPSAGPLQP